MSTIGSPLRCYASLRSIILDNIPSVPNEAKRKGPIIVFKVFFCDLYFPLKGGVKSSSTILLVVKK